MAIYTILIQCSFLFIWETAYCSGQKEVQCNIGCKNGGLCSNNTCNCLKGYSGDYCELEYLGNGTFRKIKFITANETNEDILPQLKKRVDTDLLYFKVDEGCACNVTLLQEDNTHTVEFIMNNTNKTNMSIRKSPNLFTINVSCSRFRYMDVFISWNSNVFIFGTVHLINNTFWKRTVERYQLDGRMYRTIFSSKENIAWILYEAVVDDKHAVGVKSFGRFSQLCPIFPPRAGRQLHVNFLNRSSRCSANLEMKAVYINNTLNNISIKYRCSITTGNCNVLQQILWITACQSASTGCNNCKILSFRLDITEKCLNSASYTIVTDNANDRFDISQYLIIWHEIKDVFSQDQSSSQRPSPTAKVFTTIFSDSASYTTVGEQSSSTRSSQTTGSLIPTYNEHVSFTSTAGNMLIDDNKPDPISDNQKVIGLTVGASLSAAIIVILLICLLLVLRRRSIERKSAKKNQTVHNSEDGNDYTGRQNIALPMQADLSEYNELAMRRDSHQYGDLKSAGTKPDETTYDYIDHHQHKQETDICKIDKINSIQDPGDELIHDYSVLDPNEKTLNTVKVNMSNTGRDGDTSAVIGPDESTTLCSGTDNSDRLDKPCFESNSKHTKELTCSQTKDEAYAVLDPNITGFDRTENVAKNESAETYTVLDPSITGFNRSDLTHGPGDMTMDHVNKKSLIQPYKEDGTDYEFAKPIDDDMSSRSCLPSYRDRANSGGSYGTYQTDNTHRLHGINQQNSEENVYNRTVDDVYDSAAHKQMPNSRDDTYDHFSGEKKND